MAHAQLTLKEVELEAVREERDVARRDAEDTHLAKDEIIRRAWEVRDQAAARKNAAEIDLARTRIDVLQINSQLLEAIQQKIELSQQLDQWQVTTWTHFIYLYLILHFILYILYFIFIFYFILYYISYYIYTLYWNRLNAIGCVWNARWTCSSSSTTRWRANCPSRRSSAHRWITIAILREGSTSSTSSSSSGGPWNSSDSSSDRESTQHRRQSSINLTNRVTKLYIPPSSLLPPPYPIPPRKK